MPSERQHKRCTTPELKLKLLVEASWESDQREQVHTVLRLSTRFLTDRGKRQFVLLAPYITQSPSENSYAVRQRELPVAKQTTTGGVVSCLGVS